MLGVTELDPHMFGTCSSCSLGSGCLQHVGDHNICGVRFCMVMAVCVSGWLVWPCCCKPLGHGQGHGRGGGVPCARSDCKLAQCHALLWLISATAPLSKIICAF